MPAFRSLLIFTFNRFSIYIRQYHKVMSSKVVEKRRLEESDITNENDHSPQEETLRNEKHKKPRIENCLRPSTSKVAKHTSPIKSEPLEKPEVYIENGLRMVKPYWFKYMTSVKGRWQGKKLIDVLKQEFHGKNPDFFETAIRLNRLTVNGNSVSLNYDLKPHDIISNVAHRHEVPILDRPFKVIFDDENALVVDKPCSLPVHPCGRYYFNSLTKMLETDFGYKDLKLMHRLDRLTSGLIIMSKNTITDLKLKKELVDRTVQKEYMCLVDGEFGSEPVECTMSLYPCEPKMGIQWIVPEENSVADVNGKKNRECITRFELIKTNGKVSVVRCTPKTGRTHQIRVHLQYLGYPIVNDYMYNSLVWGPEKGKGASYGKSHDQLRQDLIKEFGAENWVIDFEQSYNGFMNHKDKLDDDQGHVDSILRSICDGKSTHYDPFCIDCHSTARIPTEANLQMFLHCWKYKGSDWAYETDLPDWSKEIPDVFN